MDNNIKFIETRNFEIHTKDLLDFIKNKTNCNDILLHVTDSADVEIHDKFGNIKFSAGDIIDLVAKEVGCPIRIIIPSIRENNNILYFIEYIEPKL